METIKNYLENMFMHLPNNEEVRRAKDELASMMEDKYTELISEGKTENEAVGTVIAEFGNLSELAEALGIDNVMNSKNENGTVQYEESYTINRRMVTMDEAFEYIKDASNHGFRIGLGVMFVLFSVVGSTLSEAFGIGDALGVASLFICIAIAIGLFITSGTAIKKWDYLKKQPCAIDFATFKAVKDIEEQNKVAIATYKTVGIILCVLSIAPAAIFSEINLKIPHVSLDDLGGTFLFLFVGVGVLCIVYSSYKEKSYKILLGLNDANTVAGNYDQEYKVNGNNSKKNLMNELYWPTITCIYLSWSFLTYDWHITWVIWPIAAIGSPLIAALFKD